MLDEYKKKQSLFYTYLTKSVSNGKISHAYIIETRGVSYAFSLALDMAKYLLCSSLSREEAEIIGRNIDSGNYPDIEIIENERIIKKEQILKLKKDFSNKALYGKYMIYIIKDANKMNDSSYNSLLKFLEEPGPGVIAILMVDNLYSLKDTVISRCQILSLNPEEKDVFKFIYETIDDDSISHKLIDDYMKFYTDLESLKDGIMLYDYYYNFKDYLNIFLNFGLSFYSDVLNLKLGRSISNFSLYGDDLNKVMVNLTTNDIIRRIGVINELIIKTQYNINFKLFINDFIFKMLGGDISD